MIKENNITISCIVATHNRDELLIKTLESIFNQSLLPNEIIVVDNCNSNKTKTIVSNFQKKGIEIIYVTHNYGGKGSTSRNLGSMYSNYKYLAMIDDDDLWEKNYLKEATRFIKKNEKTKIFYTWFNYIVKNNNVVSGKRIKEDLKYESFLITNPGAIISNLIIEKKLFSILGGFNELIHPSYDRDLIIKAIKRGYKYKVLKQELVLMRNQNQFRDSSINLQNIYGQMRFIRSHTTIFPLFVYFKFICKLLYQIILKNK